VVRRRADVRGARRPHRRGGAGRVAFWSIADSHALFQAPEIQVLR